MNPPEKLRPSSGQIVPRTTKAKVKVTALLPEIGKEEAKARKVRDQVQTDQVAAEEAAEAQKVRVDLKEKAAKKSVASRVTRLQPRVEAPLPLASQICLCASISLMGLATKVKTATFITRRFASTTRRENARRALLVKTITSIPMQRNAPQTKRRRSLQPKLASVWLMS
jgi:hypothetical protein